MKLDRLNEYVLITTVMVIGILLAIYCGRLSGTGDSSHLIIMTAFASAVIICLWMRTYLWILIPGFWMMSGQLNSAPGHLPFRDLIVIMVTLFFFTLKAFKIIRFRPVYTWLDGLLLVNLLYVLSTYLRNPVGVNSFGSDLVGGRPYLEIIFAIAAYWVLNQVVAGPRLSRWLPILFTVVPAGLALLSTFTYLFPSTAPILGKLYGGVDTETYNVEQRGGGDPEGDSRAQYLAGVGGNIFSLLYSYFSPLTFINPMYIWHWKRFPLIYIRPFTFACIAFYFCLKSGHRLTIPGIAFTLLLAAYFRKGIAAVVIILLIICPLFAILIAGQGTFYELPETAQRTLSMFPGKWNPNVLLEAQGSTQWRLEMWDMAMHESKYIHNKTFGDGFGFTREVLSSMTDEGSQEDFVLVGDVHSGPISAIRSVGYIGLALFIFLRIGCAIRAWKLIRATKGTNFFPLALFVGVPTIYGLFGFIFIFGAYGQDFPNTIETIALLNLLSNAFAAYRKSLETQTLLPGKIPLSLSPMPVPVLTH